MVREKTFIGGTKTGDEGYQSRGDDPGMDF